MLELAAKDVDFDGKRVYALDGEREVSLQDIAVREPAETMNLSM